MYMYFFDSNENNMSELNKRMYNNKKNKNYTVVFFLAPWCGHCKNLKPVIDSIQSDLNTKKYNGIMARVYDDNIDKMRYKRNINGFPTISVFNNKGKYEDYKGSRDEKDLSSFLVSVFKKNQERFEKIKKSKRLKQRLKGLRKGKKVLRRIKKKSRKNPLKNISTIYKNIRNTLKKRRNKKKKENKYETPYQMGGKTKKKSKKRVRKRLRKKKWKFE